MTISWSRMVLGASLLVLFIIYLIYRYMTRNFNYWKNRGVIFVPPSPFLGNFGEFLLGKKSVANFTKAVYNYAPNEPYVGFFGFDKPMLMIRDVGLINQILVKDFNYFDDRFVNAGAHDILGNSNLFVLKNPAWKILRKNLTPIFTSGKLKEMVKLIKEVGEDLITHMEHQHLEESGQVLEVKEICLLFTIDMIATTAFGVRANSLNNPTADFGRNSKEMFRETLYRSIEQISLFFAPALMTPLRFHLFPKNLGEFMRKVIWDAISEREKSGIQRHDLIDLLIELKNQKPDEAEETIFEFQGDTVVAQAALFFVAGFETSSSTMSFALYELAVKPEIQNRLRREITDAIERNGGRITYDLIMQLPYLDMVVSETLRKYPPLPLLDRLTRTDYRVPGTDLIIEKGTPVYISLTGLHSDPKYHNNPEEFDPERFSDVNKHSTKRGWNPFGEGPHSCIGRRLGLLQSKLGIIEMLRNYQFTPCERTPIPMVLSKKGLTMRPRGGLYLHVKKIHPHIHST
ncbi:cytochrome P450 6k1-like [Diachasmimorpha longicaudata]|uniref:cytochrome P450 6k1-like n=1 Tax=Diachasmimorpha longicaudata TaxID=58733 RepID=UPI0030B8E113